MAAHLGLWSKSTFDELATIDLARCYFEGYDMVLGREAVILYLPYSGIDLGIT